MSSPTCLRCGDTLEKQSSGYFRCSGCGMEVAPENLREK